MICVRTLKFQLATSRSCCSAGPPFLATRSTSHTLRWTRMLSNKPRHPKYTTYDRSFKNLIFRNSAFRMTIDRQRRSAYLNDDDFETPQICDTFLRARLWKAAATHGDIGGCLITNIVIEPPKLWSRRHGRLAKNLIKSTN